MRAAITALIPPEIRSENFNQWDVRAKEARFRATVAAIAAFRDERGRFPRQWNAEERVLGSALTRYRWPSTRARRYWTSERTAYLNERLPGWDHPRRSTSEGGSGS